MDIINNNEDIKKISLPSETWIGIFDNKYAVSSRGRIVSFYFKGKYRLRILTQRASCGYFRVHINNETFNKNLLVHRLVAESFVQKEDETLEVNHINGNKLDNRAVNLEWVTKSQNKRHSIDILKRQHPAKGKSFEESFTHKGVNQFDLNMNLIKSYYSIQVAERDTGVVASNISRCANGKRKTAGGFIWRFK